MIIRFFLFIVALFISLSSAAHYLSWNEINPSESSCDLKNSIWIKSDLYKSACLKYFSSGSIIEGEPILISLYGDRVSFVNTPIDKIPNNTYEMQVREAKEVEKKYGVKSIVLARPGTYGSSGDHNRRRTKGEYFYIAKSIEMLHEKYNFGDIYLMGQSGGSTAIAGVLLEDGPEIKCALLTSGAYFLALRANYHREKNSKKKRKRVDTTGLKDFYDPAEHVSKKIKKRISKIVVAGDFRDVNTPYILQYFYFALLRINGVKSVFLTLEAKPPMYHSILEEQRIKAFNECLRE